MMTEEQMNKCVALLLAIAFDSATDKKVIQQAAKKLLAELPQEVVAIAAGTKVQF